MKGACPSSLSMTLLGSLISLLEDFAFLQLLRRGLGDDC
jgi:hypothetical protein